MRLFVALTPPAQALAEVERAVAPLRAGWPALRWVGADRWHVTLAFLGEVGQDRLGELSTRLERAAGRHPAAEVHLGRGGAFPSAAKARVLCVRVAGWPEQVAGLRALAGSVAAGARRAGCPPPDAGRRYRPHVTLARSREPADLGALVAALAEFCGSAWTAGQIDLIRSHTGPQPRYEPVGSWPLRPRAAAPRPG